MNNEEQKNSEANVAMAAPAPAVPLRGLKIKNINFIGLVRWLQQQELGGKDSRMRTNFIDVCKEHVNDINTKRISLLEKYAKKDEKGQPLKYTDENNQENYDLDDLALQDVNKEFEAYMSEDYVIPVVNDTWQAPHLRKLFGFVKDLLENTRYKFVGKEAEDYDRWCSAFEALSDADIS